METAYVDDIPRRYLDFARFEVRDRTPVFQAWARGVSGDPGTCALIARLPRIKRQPVLLFAAARHLGAPDTQDYAQFRDFLHENWIHVERVVLTHSTQTNEAARCGVLLPFLASIPGPLSLVETGASAGLCLYPDRYAYRFTVDGGETTEVRPTGATDRTPVLDCDLRDGIPVPRSLPDVVHRGGVDLSPVDPRDADSRAWLRSLIWPGQGQERIPRLDAALDIAAADPPHILEGDLLDRTAEAVSACPPGSTPVVFHTAVLGYLDEKPRRDFVELVTDLDCVWISVEGITLLPDVAEQVPESIRHHRGLFVVAVNGRALATAHGHGRWVRALD